MNTTVGAAAGRVDAVVGHADATADDIRAALVEVRRVRSWADAREAALVARLDGLVSFPEAVVAETSKRSLSQSAKVRERSQTLAATPALADALQCGDVTAHHLDAVTRASKRLDTDQRSVFAERADALADVARHATVADFSKRLILEAKRLQRDDGEARLDRQRRATRLSTWTDDEGMLNLRGRFDPELAIPLAARLDTAVQTLFAEQTPPCCPDDPVEKNKFLAAHALARLLSGDAPAPRSGRPEFVAVIDADAPTGTPGPCVEWAIPVELPAAAVASLAGDATATGVVVRNGVVVHAPGQLDLGRSTRLASAAQRRALRALYRHCAIPGCAVRFDRCKVHHLTWWRHGGRTDLANLLPVCSQHHTKIHADGWVVELGAQRELTLTLPDGTVRNTGPPSRRAP